MLDYLSVGDFPTRAAMTRSSTNTTGTFVHHGALDALRADLADNCGYLRNRGLAQRPRFPYHAQAEAPFDKAVADMVHLLGLSVGLKGNNSDAAILESDFDRAQTQQFLGGIQLGRAYCRRAHPALPLNLICWWLARPCLLLVAKCNWDREAAQPC